MRRTCAGGSSAIAEQQWFELFFRRHSTAVYRYSLRHTGDPEAAEDVRSAVFCEAWRRRSDIDFDDRDGLPWLFGTARNVIRNQSRALRRRDAALRRFPRPLSDFELYEDIADRLDAVAFAELFEAELAPSLPPGERAVVVLCILEGMSYTAAAEHLGVPIGTVRSRLSRARTRLGSTWCVG
jgi:RNA polymerase sigma factor (sigma-70 family)